MKICEYCGKEFEPKQQRSKYCSRLCQVYGCRSQEKKSICQCCGREYIQQHGREKYCSDDCRIKVINEKKKEAYNKSTLTGKPKICEECGKEFFPHSEKQRFCCKSCSSKHNRKDQLKRKKKRGPRLYGYQKNTGVEAPKPKPKQIEKLSPASQRWASMSWWDLTLELDKFGLTYKESQIMAKNNTLPKEFGYKKRGRKKKEEGAI